MSDREYAPGNVDDVEYLLNNRDLGPARYLAKKYGVPFEPKTLDEVRLEHLEKRPATVVDSERFQRGMKLSLALNNGLELKKAVSAHPVAGKILSMFSGIVQERNLRSSRELQKRLDEGQCQMFSRIRIRRYGGAVA